MLQQSLIPILLGAMVFNLDGKMKVSLFRKSKMMLIFLLIIPISELNFIQKFEVVWKESLNNGGHLIHQYQQNEQSPLVLAELTEH